jgi:hypothetical protein
MRLWHVVRILFASLALAAGGALAGEIVEEGSKESFPDPVTIQTTDGSATLRATGAALRKKLLWKVYAVVGYADERIALGEDPGLAIVESKLAKRMHLRMLRDVDAQKIANGVNEALEKCATVPLDLIAEERQQFLDVFGSGELKKGDDLQMTYLPGEGLQLVLNDEVQDVIPGDRFAKAFFQIYFGQVPVDKGLKEKLLAAIP